MIENVPSEDAGRYFFRYDEAKNVLFVVLNGFLDAERASSYCSDLEGWVAKARRKDGVLRLVVDARQAKPSTNDVATLVSEKTTNLASKPDDRVATVLKEVVLKFQAARVARGSVFQFFGTLEAAEAWACTAD